MHIFSVDATSDDGRLGRLVNDSPSGNCTMRRVLINKEPRLCLFASKNINVGEELRYDYGVKDLPWRTKVGLEKASHLLDSKTFCS